MKKTTWLGILFVVLVLGYLVTSSFRRQPYRCQICISFKGQRDCGIGASQTESEAVRTATTIACAQLSGGVTETNQCENTPPDSVQWLARR
ncbi:MAG TPA: hypothetical protein VHW09_32540 [Bryobacteraceae bacterium]|nr:hypothetical protein [Bryobacteraceae bacterium]